MPSKICDRTPCDLLSNLIHSLVPADATYGYVQIDVEIQRKRKKANHTHARVTLEYCPFCGTRIDPEWFETVRKRLAL